MDVLHPPSFDANLPRDARSHEDDEGTLHSHHRRIELQSPQDLLYLKNNVLHAAQAKIELHLPLEAALRNVSTAMPTQSSSGVNATTESVGGSTEDTMRKGVEVQVDAWITALFDEAKRNISVNGIDGEDIQWIPPTTDGGTGGEFGAEEYEVYDTRLAARIAALYATIEQLNLELADTRRSAVGRAVKGFTDRYAKEEADMETALARSQAAENTTQGISSREDLGLWAAKRQDDVKATWENAVQGLKEMRQGLGETLTKAQRASGVVNVMEGENSSSR